MVISGYEDDLIPRYKEEIKQLIKMRESIDRPSVLRNQSGIDMINNKIQEYEEAIERASKSVKESKEELAALEGAKTTSLADIARQSKPEDLNDPQLDLDIDFGETAENIGDLGDDFKPDLESVRTSLKELKKSCD